LMSDVEMEKSKTISYWAPNWRSAIKQSKSRTIIFLFHNWNLQSILQENPKRRRKWKRTKEPS
jgi:hypothetical protein